MSSDPINLKVYREDSSDGDGVGLSDPRLSSGRRQMLDLVNGLHSTGVQVDIDLPMTAVIGSQSAGKSSLIESISGITLPRASGTCTRCPTECRLSSSTDPWSCTVSLRFMTDALGQTIPVRNVAFGEMIYEKSQVEERIRRAQLAILNPSTSPLHYLNTDDGEEDDREVTFSTNCVCLHISGPGVADLSFVDLPGLIASVGIGGNPGDIELVKNLVTQYIQRDSCIILLTIACETDFENQGAHHLAQKYDPEGKRTIGVLTKPDRIQVGDEDRWIKLLKNEFPTLTLANGWFSVKQPDSRALASGITWSEARCQEHEFFANTAPWSGLPIQFQNHLETTNLTERCSDILSELIAKWLPVIQDELQKMLKATDDRLLGLPRAPSLADAVNEVYNLVSKFTDGLSAYLEGTPEGDGLLQSLRPSHDKFRKVIRSTAPDFRPYERNVDVADDFVAPNILIDEEPHFKPEDDRNAIFVDEVMTRAQEAITRELPGYYPFVVVKQYIADIISLWEIPSRNLHDDVETILMHKVKEFIRREFSQYPQLQLHVTCVMTEHISTCSKSTVDRLDWLLELEKQPRTSNDHYYRSYFEKFAAYYKACRLRSGDQSLVEKLKAYDSRSPDESSFGTAVTEILAGFSKLGISRVTPADLLKVLPSDPYEAAIGIMASVRAYFQVAYKRFADNVPNAVDHELILGLDRDKALEKVLRKELGISGPDGHRQCLEYLQEPLNVSRTRGELTHKRDRLLKAKRELMRLRL
ncbi:uncharacterized protein FIBRA_08279 [Fibroporia radiculosa]|uniref:GED domain-containing protein n=1 Tax=Fibroporia radiculosa TaxID=599839 RepID=J4GH03_9APHY|nr:uncharacterized protein FIBRA_08279 [Fibroporia radiculosa]CCM06033.1 predicted protein [Fibroporia radiculosa]